MGSLQDKEFNNSKCSVIYRTLPESQVTSRIPQAGRQRPREKLGGRKADRRTGDGAASEKEGNRKMGKQADPQQRAERQRQIDRQMQTWERERQRQENRRELGRQAEERQQERPKRMGRGADSPDGENGQTGRQTSRQGTKGNTSTVNGSSFRPGGTGADRGGHTGDWGHRVRQRK